MKYHRWLLVLGMISSASIALAADALTEIQHRLDAEQLVGIKAFVVRVTDSSASEKTDEAEALVALLDKTIRTEFSKIGATLITKTQLEQAQLTGSFSTGGTTYTPYEIASFLCFISDVPVSKPTNGLMVQMIRHTQLSLIVLCPNPRKHGDNLWTPVWERSFFDIGKKPSIDEAEILSATRDMLMRYLAANRDKPR